MAVVPHKFTLNLIYKMLYKNGFLAHYELDIYVKMN